MSMVCRLMALDRSGLKTLIEEPDSVLDTLFPDADDGAVLDIDKSWHALHFAFAGTAWGGEWPSSFLVEGGELVGIEEDWGYGQPRAFTPAEVQEIFAAIDGITTAKLRTRFATLMEQLEIYPAGWTTETDWENFIDYFAQLQEFLRSASANENALVISLS